MSEGRLEALARAKINLFLHVGTKRADGYHPIASWIVFTALGDNVVVEPADHLSLTIDGPFAAEIPSGADNLVMKAAIAAQGAANAMGYGLPGTAIFLTKRLPPASGLGGGSADAAATLHLLNEAWRLEFTGQELLTGAAELGSDVPACAYNQSVIATGRGETLAVGPRVPDLPIVLVNPGIGVSTADVFMRLAQRRGTAVPALPNEIRDGAHLSAILAATGNDLEEPACRLVPAIREVLGALRTQDGALIARMSGSGATCFALFAEPAAAQAAAIAIKRARPAWWVSATRLDC